MGGRTRARQGTGSVITPIQHNNSTIIAVLHLKFLIGMSVCFPLSIPPTHCHTHTVCPLFHSCFLPPLLHGDFDWQFLRIVEK